MDNVIKYSNFTFNDIVSDLKRMIKDRYPEIYSDFTDAGIGSALIDINAGVCVNLSMELDRTFQETQRKNAQLRSSLLDIASTLGVRIPGKRPSVSLVDFTVTIPVLGDGPDQSYYPTMLPGAVITGAGRTFETIDVVDWKSPFSSFGDPNRKIIPNKNSNGVVVNYSVTKREIVINGTTKIFKRVITDDDVIPFFSLTLPEFDVIGVDSVILLEGTNITNNPPLSRFYDDSVKYYEVDYLAEQKIFVDDFSGNSDVVKAGKWKYIKRKYITEYQGNGLLKLTFGSGDSDVDIFKDGFIKNGFSNNYLINNYLNNTALGEKLKSGYTLFIKYRVGGGSNSNLGSGVLNQMGAFDMLLTGSRQNINQDVRRSLSVTNPIPAIGGNDGLSVEQIRELIGYNYSNQNRSITLSDYKWMVYKMNGRYGSPYRVNTFKENNKVIVSILGVDSNGRLSNVSNSLLKENISKYLSGYRTINDYLEIRDGKIYNLGFDIDVYVSDVSDVQTTNNIIKTVREYFNINKYEMNSDIFLGDLERKILDVVNVINIIGIKAYNYAGGEYSNNVISQDILDVNTGEIKKINNTIYSDRDSMFEIKFPEKDIRVYLRKNVS